MLLLVIIHDSLLIAILEVLRLMAGFRKKNVETSFAYAFLRTHDRHNMLKGENIPWRMEKEKNRNNCARIWCCPMNERQTRLSTM